MRPLRYPLALFTAAALGHAQTFTDVAPSAGLTFGGYNTASSAWRDFDGDGDPDLFLPINGGSYQPNDILARNEGNGQFLDVAGTAGVQGHALLSFQLAAAWADHDSDGDPDLFVTNSPQPYQLFRNDGNGTFTDVASAAGLAGVQVGGTAAIWVDADADGAVDLLVTRWGEPNLLFQGDGSGGFTEVGAAAGVAHGTAASGGASFADYDGDGDLDLYSCSVDTNDPGRLFRNEGNLTFSDVSAAAGIAPIRAGAACWADLDGDGHLDLYVSDAVHGALTGFHYRNEGDGTFEEVGLSSGLRFPVAVGVTTRSASVADYDLDGDLDVYVTCTNTYSGTLPPANRLFRNDGFGVFDEVGGAEGVDDTRYAEGSSWADYDGDGDLDLFVANDWPEDCRLYRNDVTGAHWVRFELEGTTSHRDAAGAVLRLFAGGSWQLRQLGGGGTGGNCQDDAPVVFGVGSAISIELLEIRWPSGLHEVYPNLAVDTAHALVEGAGSGCPPPTSYCLSSPNSVGTGAVLTYSGSTSCAANDFQLHASGAPPGEFAVYFYGPSQLQLPFFDGVRCVGAGGVGVFRILPPQTTDGSGNLTRHVDFTTGAMSTGPGKIDPGNSWNFQLWYRDPNGPLGTGANTSDALSVLFCL